MKVALRVGVIVFFLAATAFARTPASRGTALSDKQLDGITAGADEDVVSGGAIVVDNSTASLVKKGNVSLGTSAQKDAKAMNLVNSANGAVANGVNVWDGRLKQGEGDIKAPNLKVTQDNKLFQAGGGVAFLPSYINGGRLTTEEFGRESLDKSSSSKKQNDVSNTTFTKTTRNVTSTSEVDGKTTVVGQNIQAGKGVAGSGKLNVTLDAGNISFVNSIEGKIKILGFFEGEAKLTTTLTWTLPKLTVDFDGTVCAVMSGSCKAGGSLNQTLEDRTDKSTFALETSTSSKRSTRSFEKSSFEIKPVTLTNARAEIIVADNSKLTSNTDFSVSLTGFAQQNARALNIVNAAGSLVANGVNVARTPTLGPNIALTLNQTNVITQHL